MLIPPMREALAIIAAVATLGILLVGTILVRRRSFLVRQLTFPILIGAATAAIAIFAVVRPGYSGVDHILSWLLIFLGFATALRLLGMLLFDLHLPGQPGLRLPPLLPAVIMALVYLVTAMITLKVTVPSLDLAPMLATSAVTSLVLGLALQPILANFFAGIVISVERPFRINDWIRVGEHEGRVVAMTWRTTHLRTRDNDNLVVPNAKLADERVLNFAYPHPTHLERVRVGVSNDVPPYRVRRILTECATGVAGILDNPTADTTLVAFEESATYYELRVWIDEVAQAPRIASDLRCRIWEELHKAGIEMPHAIRTVQLTPRRRPVPPPDANAPAYGARIYVLEGPERGDEVRLGGTPALVGRARTCSLPLTDPNASKEHLKVEWTGDGYTLTDLGSRFGTKVNGQTASQIILQVFDRITVGDTVMIFETDAH
jgi:small-conductance mechanosensitive channel